MCFPGSLSACSLHAAHFKLQRCQDRFAAELGIPALKAGAAGPAGAVPSSSVAAAAAAAAEAAEALDAVAAQASRQQQQQQAGEVPVPGVRLVISDTGGRRSLQTAGSSLPLLAGGWWRAGAIKQMPDATALAAPHEQPCIRCSTWQVPLYPAEDADMEGEGSSSEEDEGSDAGVPEQAILTVCEFTGEAGGGGGEKDREGEGERGGLRQAQARGSFCLAAAGQATGRQGTHGSSSDSWSQEAA